MRIYLDPSVLFLKMSQDNVSRQKQKWIYKKDLCCSFAGVEKEQAGLEKTTRP